jgi:hypothetical protein
VHAPADLLEWFRVDRARGVGWLLVTGATLVFVGALLVGGGVLTHTPSDTLRHLTLLGAAMLVFGLVTAFGGMTVLLAQDEYLAVRADGVLVHRAGGDVVLPWAEVLAVRYDAVAAALVFDAKEEPYVLKERYSGASGAELAAHLEELRRKATLAPLDYAQVGRIALGLPHKRPK